MNIWKDLSPEEEKTFRERARENYKKGTPIDELWHPIIKDECKKMNTEEQENKLLMWVAYCSVCGEINKAPNGTIIEAAAKKHKQENAYQYPAHTVILGTYIET